MDELVLSIDRGSGRPLAVQVADELRAAAIAGGLRGGDRLPSSRALARQLGVSRTVVTSAYDQLHAEGWISGRHGSGTYLAATPASAPEHTGVEALSDLGADLLDLVPGTPCVEAIDRAAWRRAWRAAGDRPPSAHKHRAGEPDYLATVAEHLLLHRGLTPGRDTAVLATAGIGTAVGELAHALFRPGDAVAIEDPGYQRAVGGLRNAGIRVVPVPTDADGLRVDLIPAGVRGVYCTPAHQFPLGARMPAARRVELVDFARRTGTWILEDDYDGELRYDSAPLPLLATLAPDRVIHLGTTSKILSTSLGTGWLVATREVTKAVLASRESAGTCPPPAGQLMLTELARHGDLARHLRRLRREMPPRRALVVATLRARGLTVAGDHAGSHVLVPLASAAAEQRAVVAARRRGVRLDSLARHHTGDRHAFGVPIGYAALSRAELEHAIGIAADCLAAEHPLTSDGTRLR
ncbi:putative transcriptional regulator [Nocardia nova SH22a]|uniref:Putative transcriptional regulator n=1 Tax=Nocardia nova SH22a TaxID=1415166 RepID=W5TQC3_9NOCA|nr:PLP-dependent aminotransferase family protein [Nocardia nova]AHH21585.1 putative transcriptional regulator [Nocardia nova SH22a]